MTNEEKIIQSAIDEIKSLKAELKRVTKLKDGLKNDVHILTDNSKVNVNLLDENKQLKEELELCEKDFYRISKQRDNLINALLNQPLPQ